MPPDSSVGFAPADWVLFLVTGFLLLVAFVWRPKVPEFLEAFARRTSACMLMLFFLPIVLRLLLLPQHPIPTPDVYDEFSHLLVADTLMRGRLANPPHVMQRFFETFFVLQEPTYSSIYPLGLGLEFAFGRLLSGIPWTGVLIATGTFCASSYWMLRAWVTPGWALLGGLFAVIEFGPLCLWTNSYWGGSLAATAGCLVFGALPRLRLNTRRQDAILLGAGFGTHMLIRQFESVLLFVVILIFLLPLIVHREEWPRLLRLSGIALPAVLPAILLILLHNRSVTHSWTTLPEQLSRYQYGVPTSLTVELSPTPHVPLTREQALDYKAQALTHGPGDSFTKFLLRLEYRVRYYRFFFLPPLYLALTAFSLALREPRMRFVAVTLGVFALGTNLFPYLLAHYLAAVTCLFVLMSVIGLQQIERLTVRGAPVGVEISRIVIVLCFAEFVSWYSLHLFETPALYPILKYETWDSINHGNPQRRIDVARQLAAIDGQLLVFVRYSPHHIYQNEWVWNQADIDGSRIVFARDLGAAEDEKLIHYYPNRKVLLLEPDDAVPRLSSYNEQVSPGA